MDDRKKEKKRAKGRSPRGIRSRVMLYLVGFVAFVLALLWLFQIVWLDEFYRWDKTRQIKNAASAVAQNVDSEQVDRLIDHFAARSDVCILLLDEMGRTVHSSEDTRDCLIHRMSSRDRAYWCAQAPEDGSLLTELFNVSVMDNMPFAPHQFRGNVPELRTNTHQSLLCVARVTMSDGTQGYLMLNTLITPLDTTVETLRIQLIAITVVVVMGAVLLAWLIARRVTRPIIQVNDAARQLARGRYEAPGDDRTYREIAELNATLTAAAQELSQVEHLQHELIANISHDLRTPLTMIGGYAEVMRDIPGEANPENMQIIIDETNRLTSLVSELLDFSKLQTGHVQMENAVFDLTGAVSEIVQRVSRMTESSGYILRFEPQEHVHVRADEKRIAQVVYNLLGNALTYTGADRTVDILQTVAADSVRIAIRDTGKGIPPEELPLIWNRYYRARESHKRAVIGSGLGLSIVQSILEKHGAKYGVDSTLGEGTTFWFELPVVPEPDDNET